MLVLFLSHSWDHMYDRQGLHRLISARWTKGVDWCDLSVPEEHPLHLQHTSHLEAAISDRIAQSELLIAFAGVYSSRSDWIEFEVETARYQGKPVVAVVPRGQRNLSSFVMDRADIEAGWNGRSVREAILDALPRSRRAQIEPQLRRSERIAEILDVIDLPRKPQAGLRW